MSAQDDEGRRPALERRGQRTNGDDELGELKSLLFGPEEKRLDRLERKVDAGRIDAADVSALLPRAIALREGDPEFNAALAPTVEDAIEISVRKNPKPLVDAIFPVIGPAIRRAIRAALAGMTEGFNESLENSFSVRGLRWRLQAWKTGVPFAEIVLLNSLVYRVEQVFLVHAETGILLASVVEPTIAVQDADLVAGMLTAIQDFVQDSFNADSENESITQIQFGEHVLEVVTGPQAALAAVVRGRAPERLRLEMQRLLERIHASVGVELAEFGGETDPFRSVRPLLALALSREQAKKVRRFNVAYVLICVVTVALLVLGGLELADWAARRGRSEVRDKVLAELRAKPGIIVLEHAYVGGTLVVKGLRDPKSADPRIVLSELVLDPSAYRVDFQPFYSDAFVAERAREVLDPPETVELRFDKQSGTLRALGSAPREWKEVAASTPTMLLGIMRYDDSALVITEDE